MITSNHYFIAIKLNENIKKWIYLQQEKVKLAQFPYHIWLHEEDFHVTLQFLGELTEEKKSKLSKDLERLENFPSFKMVLKGINGFGKVTQPRVLWIGVEKSDKLNDLHHLVKTICESNACPTDNRTYIPHITIAKKWKNKSEYLGEYSRPITEVISTTINEIALYRINPTATVKYIPEKIVILDKESVDKIGPTYQT